MVAQGERSLKIVSAEFGDASKEHESPGEVLSCDAAGGKIEVACRRGSVMLTGVLPEGKSRMSAKDFINGRKIAVGDRLTKYSK